MAERAKELLVLKCIIASQAQGQDMIDVEGAEQIATVLALAALALQEDAKITLGSISLHRILELS